MGKTGEKGIADGENKGNLFFGGKQREFENLMRDIQYQENNWRKNYCVTSIR